MGKHKHVDTNQHAAKRKTPWVNKETEDETRQYLKTN